MIKMITCLMFSLLGFLISQTYAIEVQQGTLNFVIANGNNALVATDSRATITKEGSRTFDDHYQKLFQITDDIVVTVAGYGSATVPAAKELTTPVGAIILQYVDELKQKKHTPSYKEVVTSLPFLLQFYLTAIASVNSVTTPDFDSKNYVSQMIIVGKKSDGFLIKKILIQPRKNLKKRGALTFDISYESEKRKGKLAYQTAGIDDIANKIIRKPRDYQSDPTKQLADQIEKDGGSKMSASDMQSLAEFVMKKSNESDQRIGGQTQFAIFENKKLRISSEKFPASAKVPFRFSLATKLGVNGVRLLDKPSNVIFLFIDSRIANVPWEMGKDLYFGNTFINCTMYVNDNSFHFDKTNKVVNSTLVISDKVDRNAPEVKELVSKFNWKLPSKGR